MKHEKQWYTCDRCGEKIKEDIEAWRWAIGCIVKHMPREEVLEIIEQNPCGYVSNIEVYERKIVFAYWEVWKC